MSIKIGKPENWYKLRNVSIIIQPLNSFSPNPVRSLFTLQNDESLEANQMAFLDRHNIIDLQKLLFSIHTYIQAGIKGTSFVAIRISMSSPGLHREESTASHCKI